MKIDISDETVYNLVVDVLMNDYKYLCSDIERYQDKTILSDIEQEDLSNWISHRDALEITINYYAGYNSWK